MRLLSALTGSSPLLLFFSSFTTFLPTVKGSATSSTSTHAPAALLSFSVVSKRSFLFVCTSFDVRSHNETNKTRNSFHDESGVPRRCGTQLCVPTRVDESINTHTHEVITGRRWSLAGYVKNKKTHLYAKFIKNTLTLSVVRPLIRF